MSGKTITLLPVSTKFASITCDGRTFEIWALNPTTGKEGTSVPYDDAMKLLSLRPPVVTVKLESKNGKFVSPLDPADVARLRAVDTGDLVEESPVKASKHEKAASADADEDEEVDE